MTISFWDNIWWPVLRTLAFFLRRANSSVEAYAMSVVSLMDVCKRRRCLDVDLLHMQISQRLSFLSWDSGHGWKQKVLGPFSSKRNGLIWDGVLGTSYEMLWMGNISLKTTALMQYWVLLVIGKCILKTNGENAPKKGSILYKQTVNSEGSIGRVRGKSR